MLKYYTNPVLAGRFGINPAKWKRWAREFLPPDPIAGLQSGYARHFYTNDAFRVFLGGHLVSALRFTVPEARRILSDLSPWLKKNGFSFDLRGMVQKSADTAKASADCAVDVAPNGRDGFCYAIRSVVERCPAGEAGLETERFHEDRLPETAVTADCLSSRRLFLDRLLAEFQSRLNGPP